MAQEKTTFTPAEKQRRIIEHTLPFIPDLGWSPEALARGAIDAGLDPTEVHTLFLGDPKIAVRSYLQQADSKMEAQLQEVDLQGLRIPDRIALAIETRLEQSVPHKKVVRETLRFLAHPARFELALASLCRTVDTIWYSVGDQSTDFNYYTKRMLLAGVYLSTLAYWVRDQSADLTKTRIYMRKQLARVMMTAKYKAQLSDVVSLVVRPLRQFFRP